MRRDVRSVVAVALWVAALGCEASGGAGGGEPPDAASDAFAGAMAPDGAGEPDASEGPGADASRPPDAGERADGATPDAAATGDAAAPPDAAPAPPEPPLDPDDGRRLDEVPPDDELAREAGEGRGNAPGRGQSAMGWGRIDNPELRELIPIGRDADAERFVIMRLEPRDIPNLQRGDVLRAAAELQVTTRCDIGQQAPGCDYNPTVRMQLVLTGDRGGTDPSRQGSMALSDVKTFTCTKQEHHCVEVIDFTAASKTLDGGAPGCVNDNSCHINLVVWAYDRQARRGGADKLLIGANEGNFLANGEVEQDRGRLMVIRERGLAPSDKIVRETKDNVRGGGLPMASNGRDERLYSHRLAGGRDLRAGEKFRVWAVVDAETDHRVNLGLRMFLTRDREDVNGGQLEAIEPGAISEHNGTNCTPSNPCHLKKVAVFQVQRDLQGPVFVNISGNCEVPGPGSARVTIKNSGFVKSIRYLR